MLCLEQDNSSDKTVKYGELVVLGCNGSLPGGDRGRRRSRFSLYKRATANGVKPGDVHIACSPEAAKVISKNSQHSVSYTLSWAQTVVVEYTEDNDTDMFQIGRSTESPIDMVVAGTAMGSRGNGDGRLCQSTISRFACRIVCERNPPYTARLYAAGFDCSKNIFLGEKAAKWRSLDGQMDGLTTNGVLLMRPPHGLEPDSKPGVWREVSVCGNVYTLRGPRYPQNKGKLVKDECPVLLDGSLIDLCGVTLLWRSPEGLARAPTFAHLEVLRHRLNAARPRCPVMLDTLAFPSLHADGSGSGPGSGSKSGSSSGSDAPRRAGQPWAYLNCGHVHGYHRWRGCGLSFKEGSAEEEEEEEEEEENERMKGGREKERIKDEEAERECPLCRARGPYVALALGRESRACVDAGPPSHAFVPCGHVCSEATVTYWSKTPLLRGARLHQPACPFCTKPLARDKPFVRLIFQGSLD